jgi:hypothetical protein
MHAPLAQTGVLFPGCGHAVVQLPQWSESEDVS